MEKYEIWGGGGRREGDESWKKDVALYKRKPIRPEASSLKVCIRNEGREWREGGKEDFSRARVIDGVRW